MTPKASGSEFFIKINKLLDALASPDKYVMLSHIEKDILKEKLRKIYDQLSLSKESEAPGAQPVELEMEVVKENLISSAFVEEQIHQSETESTEIASEDLVSEEVAKEKKVIPRTFEKEPPDLFTPAGHGKKPETKTVIEAITEETLKESIAEKLQKHAKVETLKKAIGINEKFFFINELFDGNLNEYNAAIDSLDKKETIEESAAFLEELSHKYNWQGNAEALEQLRHFVERKLK